MLNPLFLDDLRAQLEAAGDNPRMLLNLRKRLAKIRVCDPACGSGNFLVIAYKQMREIENAVNERCGERGRKSDIPLTNFRGIELRDFPAEIARLALIIAEYQCDVLYLGQKEALAAFLPLEAQNWITCGNALRLDWLGICPPTDTPTIKRPVNDDLFDLPTQTEIDFENAGGEPYICGNPPYKGSQRQTDVQKSGLEKVFAHRNKNWKSLDYVSAWFIKAVDYGKQTPTVTAFVSTKSICQGRQVETLWRPIFSMGFGIHFAHTSYNAGVTVVIVGITNNAGKKRKIYFDSDSTGITIKETENINAYLTSGSNVFVAQRPQPLSQVNEMSFGNMPNDGGYLLLNLQESELALNILDVHYSFIRPFLGSQEFIRGQERRCIWVNEDNVGIALKNSWLKNRFEAVKGLRSESNRATTNELAKTPYYFGKVRQRGDEKVIIVPSVSSEAREYLPVGYFSPGTIISNLAFAMFDVPLWNMALIASRLHLVWIAAVCGKLETRYRYSNTLGWNTFPVPILTDKNKADLTRCAEDILLAREAHFPATIADLYDPKHMPADLRAAHERNDETLERIYIGRRFKNDTERLEKLFDLYTQMTATIAKLPSPRKRGKGVAAGKSKPSKA